ncbi:Inversin [Holothuria leucospilota]|uniref:Inversin n=1 Tax=Holothuria leucospilota TaxID=206669 RepID=A0A9Q1BAT9_HOLLE|nr:Inversin [Holothuria leucospilota]
MASAAVINSGKGTKSSLKQDNLPASLIHAAAVNGNKATLQKLLKDPNYHVDEVDQFGRTPLMLTVLADQFDCAEVLLKNGANVDAKDHWQRTALHWAAYKGIYRFCWLLISRGAYWREKDHEELTALHLATKHTNTKCLTLILKELFVGEVDEQDVNKRTALHWSASYGNVEAVKILINEGSNIGIPDVDGKTPLHWAATAGDSPTATATVQVILDAEPSVINWQDYEGRTALHLAVADGNTNTVETLINFQTHLEKCNVSVLDNMFRTPLHWAAVLGHTHMVNRLLDKKASFSSSDGNGATALHYAAQNNHAETVEAFLSHEDITDEPDLERRTALMWAAGKGADDVIKVMMQYGGDIDATDNTGATALHAAAMAGHASTIHVLLEFGANVSVTDQNKHTPLFRAAEMGQTDALITLIEGGASVHVADDEGRSPLHWAARGGHSCVCANLLKHKISPNVQDHHGRTPLQCAAYGGFINCMNILLEEGADPDLQDEEGVTALHYASSTGYMDAVRLLLEHGAFINHMEVNEDCFTPLDHALLNGHNDVTQFMIERGALSINTIRDLAASRIQACFRGYCVRKTFLERKLLLVKHEELRKSAAARKKEQSQTPATESSRNEEANLHSEIKTLPEASVMNIVEGDSVVKDSSQVEQSGVENGHKVEESEMEGGSKVEDSGGEGDTCTKRDDDCDKLNEQELGERGEGTKEVGNSHDSGEGNVSIKCNSRGMGSDSVPANSKDDVRTVWDHSTSGGDGRLECKHETLIENDVAFGGKVGHPDEECEDDSLETDDEDIQAEGKKEGDFQSNYLRENGKWVLKGEGNDEEISKSEREACSVEEKEKLENETKKGDCLSLSSKSGAVGKLPCLDEDLNEHKANDEQIEEKPVKHSPRLENVEKSRNNTRRKSGKTEKSPHTVGVTSKPWNGVVKDRVTHLQVERKDQSEKGLKDGKRSSKLRLDGIGIDRDKQGSAVQHLKRSKVDNSHKPVLHKRSSIKSEGGAEVLNPKNDKNGELDFIQTVKLSKGKDRNGERNKLPNINKGGGSDRLVKSARYQHMSSSMQLRSATISSRDRLSSWPTTSLKSEFDWRGHASNKTGAAARNLNKSTSIEKKGENETENVQTATRPKRRQRAASAIVHSSHSIQGSKNLITFTENQPSRRQKILPRRIRSTDDGSH